MVLLPAVVRCDQFRVVSSKAFPVENAIHPQTLQLILAMAVGWCCYFPAGIHLLRVGIEKDQNFIHLEKYCRMVKLCGGESYSEYFLDNLSKPFQSSHQPTTRFQELISSAWKYPGT